MIAETLLRRRAPHYVTGMIRSAEELEIDAGKVK
jgi:hypothetical protein